MSTELTPAVRAAAEAILDQIAPGQEHTSAHQNVETYAEMATAVVRAVTPEVFEEMARVVDGGPETWTREGLAAELRQGARNRRSILTAEADALHTALFGQPDTERERQRRNRASKVRDVTPNVGTNVRPTQTDSQTVFQPAVTRSEVEPPETSPDREAPVNGGSRRRCDWCNEPLTAAESGQARHSECPEPPLLPLPSNEGPAHKWWKGSAKTALRAAGLEEGE